MLSPLGIGFTILIFLGLGFFFWQYGSAMFSPGALRGKSTTGRQSGGFESRAAFENECHLCYAPLEPSRRIYTPATIPILSRFKISRTTRGVKSRETLRALKLEQGDLQ